MLLLKAASKKNLKTHWLYILNFKSEITMFLNVHQSPSLIRGEALITGYLAVIAQTAL